jgi:hypothetical protein
MTIASPHYASPVDRTQQDFGGPQWSCCATRKQVSVRLQARRVVPQTV